MKVKLISKNHNVVALVDTAEDHVVYKGVTYRANAGAGHELTGAQLSDAPTAPSYYEE